MKLTDILAGNSGDFNNNWNETDAAGEFAPLPRGKYVARVERGDLARAKSGTPSYKLVFVITEGDHAGRKLWHDFWLTPAALPRSKRDLAKLGITSPAQLEQPIPPGIICELRVALRQADDGTERNEVRAFSVLRVEKPEADPFAPSPSPGESGSGPEGDESGDTNFDFGANSTGASAPEGGDE